METIRLNIGTYDKQIAIDIRQAIKRVKTFRKDINNVEFKSRTYGRRLPDGRVCTGHSNVPVSQADKVAVYLEVETPDTGAITLDHCQRKNVSSLILESWLNDTESVKKKLSTGEKGIYSYTDQDLINELISICIENREIK